MARNQSKYQEDFCARLQEIRKDAGFSQSAFAEALGLPRDTYAKYETRSLLPHDLIDDVAQLTGRSIDFVLTGRGDGAPTRPANDDYAAVPRWSYAASAGHGAIIEPEPEKQHEILFRLEWIRTITDAPIERLFALTVEGNSMAPTLMDGDLALIDRTRTQARSDGIYLINVDGELLVKRLQKSLTDGTWTIISDNPLYPSESGITRDLLDIEGRVMWIGRKV